MGEGRQQNQVPSIMRAFAIDRFGESGTVRELATPEIGADEFLVRVRAAGVNPLDWKIRDGRRSFGDLRFPYVLGQDAAGEIVQVGSNAKQFSLGDEVYGSFWLAGTYADYVRVTNSAWVARKPATVDFAHAAALPIPGLTALGAVNILALKGGETILVVGATGGVGSYIVQLAASRGARVIATAREDAQAHIRKLGATEVIDHTRSDVVVTVKATHPDGIDALVDVVSERENLERVAQTLRKGGRLATTLHVADEASFASRGIQATNVDVRGGTQELNELARLVDSGTLIIPLDRTFPLEAAAQALAESKVGHVRGKIVLAVA